MSRRHHDIIERLHWSRHQQTRYRESRFASLLAHAAKNVPFYEKRLRQHGLTARDVRHLKDLSALPFTTRADFDGDSATFLTRGIQRKDCVSRSRIGTGQGALRIYFSSEENEFREAVRRRIFESHGLTGRYSSLEIVPPEEMPASAGWRERLFGGKHSFLPTTETTPEFLRVLREVRPNCVIGPLWILRRMTHEIRETKALGFTVSHLFAWGEPMRDADRQALREAFGVAPIDVYRLWEFGSVAAQCPERDGLHVHFDLVFVELVRGDRPVAADETGEVVITTLANRTMPLIRYKVGDVASWKNGKCACGWDGPTLEVVHGLLDQTIFLPTGGFVTPHQFEECLDAFTNVVEYRAVQSEPRKVEILIVPGTMFQEQTANLLRTKCIELFNNQIGVELRMVDRLPPLTGERHQSVVRKVH